VGTAIHTRVATEIAEFERIITEVMRTVSEGYDVEIDEEVAKCVAVANSGTVDLGEVAPPSEAPTWAQLRGRARRRNHLPEPVFIGLSVPPGITPTVAHWKLASTNGSVDIYLYTDGTVLVWRYSTWDNTSIHGSTPWPKGVDDALAHFARLLSEEVPS
jgi:hypothetical protein